MGNRESKFKINCNNVAQQLINAEKIQWLNVYYCLRIDNILSWEEESFYYFSGENSKVNNFLRWIVIETVDTILWGVTWSWTESSEWCYLGWNVQQGIRCIVVGVENPDIKEETPLWNIANIAMILYLRALKS